MTAHKRMLPAAAALMTAFIALSPGAASPALAAQTGSSAIGITNAEKQVVSLLEIPAYYKLTQESYDKGPGGNGQYSFSFSYSSPDNQNRWANVTVDASTGAVLNYSASSSATGFVYPLPVSAVRAKQIALSWAKKLYPAQLQDVKIQPQSGYPGALTQPVTYTFDFTRMVNGIPAPFDGFTLTIDQNGQLTAAADSWSQALFPNPANAITEAAANGVYRQSLHLYLGYTTVWNSGASVPTPYLTYQPPDFQSGSGWNQPYENDSAGPLVIDAQTGELLDAAGDVTKAPVFTPPVPILKGGPIVYPGSQKVNWSEAQALSYAQSALDIPTGYHLTETNQNQTFPAGGVTWNFTWSDGAGHQISAGVDATRGVITSYNSYIPSPAPHTSTTQARIDAAAAAFVKRLFPHDTGGLAIVQQNVSQVKPGAGTVNRLLTVEAIVNGIPVLTDTAQIMVEGTTTPAVTSFWSNLLPGVKGLPSPDKVISLGRADSIWMNHQPLELEYLMTQPLWNPKHQTPQRIMLVYAPQTNPFAFGAALNAVTGQFVTNSATAQPYTGPIQDLRGVPDADQIQLLVSHGLLPVDARGYVHPRSSLTRAQFVKLVVDALGLGGGPVDRSFGDAMQMSAASPAYDAVAAAFQYGWLQSGQLFHPDQPITRGDAAQILVRALGYADVLRHPEIFRLPAQDAAQIPKNELAGDAIAYAIGMMPLVDGKFDGKAHLTVAQAAVAIVQMVTAYSEGQQIFDFGSSTDGGTGAAAPSAAPASPGQ